MKREDKYHKAKNYLSQYQVLNKKIDINHYRMLELDRKINEPQTTSVVEMVQGSKETREKGSNVMIKYIYMLEDLYLKQKNNIKNIEIKKKEIDNFIRDNTNTELEYIVLSLFYITGFSLNRISVKVSYSYSHTKRMFYLGLKSIEEALKKGGE